MLVCTRLCMSAEPRVYLHVHMHPRSANTPRRSLGSPPDCAKPDRESNITPRIQIKRTRTMLWRRDGPFRNNRPQVESPRERNRCRVVADLVVARLILESSCYRD